MASAFSHAIASLAVSRVTPVQRDRKLYMIAALCAALPDLDAIGYWTGVPYDSMWGHRGITHSFFFALLVALAVMALFYPSARYPRRTWIILLCSFFVSTASHALLDACTTGGLGVDLFAPFHDERYFLPWQVIRVSPISISKFFSARAFTILASEFVWIWVPTFVVILIASIADRISTKQRA